MARYTVPQDVEAEDKLLGPFTFRQFVYLMIAGGLAALCIPIWSVFPPLIIIFVLPIILLVVLALPLKKDQPMETYLSALVSFYLKPNTRIWEPGQPESTIIITAPKKVEENRTKNLDEEEALHRLSFLADIVDTEGYAIKGVAPNSSIKDNVYAEASNTLDMFENPTTLNASINQTLQDDASSRRNEAISQMRNAIEQNHLLAQPDNQAQPTPPELPDNPVATTVQENTEAKPAPTEKVITENPLNDDAVRNNDVIIKPDSLIETIESEKAAAAAEQEAAAKQREAEAKAKQESEIEEIKQKTDPNILDLANNKDFSIETIAKQAQRIKEKNDDEVYISLH